MALITQGPSLDQQQVAPIDQFMLKALVRQRLEQAADTLNLALSTDNRAAIVAAAMFSLQSPDLNISPEQVAHYYGLLVLEKSMESARQTTEFAAANLEN